MTHSKLICDSLTTHTSHCLLGFSNEEIVLCHSIHMCDISTFSLLEDELLKLLGLGQVKEESRRGNAVQLLWGGRHCTQAALLLTVSAQWKIEKN